MTPILKPVRHLIGAAAPASVSFEVEAAFAEGAVVVLLVSASQRPLVDEVVASVGRPQPPRAKVVSHIDGRRSASLRAFLDECGRWLPGADQVGSPNLDGLIDIMGTGLVRMERGTRYYRIWTDAHMLLKADPEGFGDVFEIWLDTSYRRWRERYHALPEGMPVDMVNTLVVGDAGVFGELFASGGDPFKRLTDRTTIDFANSRGVLQVIDATALGGRG